MAMLYHATVSALINGTYRTHARELSGQTVTFDQALARLYVGSELAKSVCYLELGDAFKYAWQMIEVAKHLTAGSNRVGPWLRNNPGWFTGKDRS